MRVILALIDKFKPHVKAYVEEEKCLFQIKMFVSLPLTRRVCTGPGAGGLCAVWVKKIARYYINTWSRRDHGPHNPATSAKVSRSRVARQSHEGGYYKMFTSWFYYKLSANYGIHLNTSI